MRKWAFDAVSTCPGQVEFAANRIYSSGSVDGAEADSPTRPFIVIRFSTKQLALPKTKVKQQGFQVWLHMEPGSMLPIDDLAGELEDWLPSQAPVRAHGDWIMDCAFQFTSPDTFDDHYKTETRYAEFLVTFRPGSD